MARAFRLASLLRVRRLEEDRAASELAAANARRTAAIERQYKDSESLAGSTFPRRTDELHWRAAVAARSALGGLLAESIAATEVAAQEAKLAERAWSAARTRAVVLDKLEQRHVLAEQVEELRLEQLQIDEIATRNAGVQARERAESALRHATPERVNR